MCGIVAALGRGSALAVEKALRSMSYRGDRSRMADSLSGAIGHVRLPIVGLSEVYDQPYVSKRGDWMLGFVGEVLDFRDEDPGLLSDFPIVINTWEKHGPGGFRKFDGFWSVVAIDRGTGNLWGLVDYLAQKPLYYRTDRPSIASEITPLLEFGAVTMDHTYLSSIPKWGYCPENHRTPFEEIRKVPPGHFIRIAPDGSYILKHVDPLYPAFGEYDLFVELDAAVRRRVLASDVPVTLLLSGGLDSSIVYQISKRYGDVQPFHIEQGTSDSLEEDASAAYQAQGSLKCVSFSQEDAPSIDDRLSVMQEPVDLGSLCPQILLSRAIRQETDAIVCLTGDGADELFGGYSRALRYDSQYSDVFHELVMWHLPRLDRVMMRERIEVRSPFLARRVVQIALGLDRSLRTDKSILKHVFRNHLPKVVTRMRKVPLRTKQVLHNSEAYWLQLVEAFKEKYGGRR